MELNINFEAAESLSSKFKDIKVGLNMSMCKLLFE